MPQVSAQSGVPAAAKCLLIQTSHRPASHLVMSIWGQEAVKAAIYTSAQNKHSPGRNEKLEGGEILARSSHYLKHPWLSTASVSVPLSRQEWLLGGADTATGPEAGRHHG